MTTAPNPVAADDPVVVIDARAGLIGCRYCGDRTTILGPPHITRAMVDAEVLWFVGRHRDCWKTRVEFKP